MRAQINGLDVTWREHGAGDVVLFLHAFPLDSAMWEPQLAVLPEGWRGVAPDLRGFGGSEGGGPEIYDMDMFAADMFRLLDHLGAKRVVVCGLSMGGYVALRMLRRHAARVRGLVLCDTRATPDSKEVRRTRIDRANRVCVEGMQPLAEAMLPKMLSAQTQRQRPDLVRWVRTTMEAASPPAVRRALFGMARRPDSTPLLRDVMIPVKIIVGAEDPITTPGEVQMVARGIRGSLLDVIPDAAHLPNLEQPDAFNEALGQFLLSLP